MHRHCPDPRRVKRTVARRSITASAALAIAWVTGDAHCQHSDASVGEPWNRNLLHELTSIRAEWVHTASTVDGHARQLRFRLWLRDASQWALMCDEIHPDPTARVDLGIRGDTWWTLDGSTLRYRPATSRLEVLHDGDLDPELTAALLQLGHFVHGGRHLAAVLGDDQPPHEVDGAARSFTTSFGCRIRLEGGAEPSLTILENPLQPEQDGVVYRYREVRTLPDEGRAIARRVEHFVPSRSEPENILELVAIESLGDGDAIPHPDLDTEYPRSMDEIHSVIDTRGPFRRELARGRDGRFRAISTPKSALHYGSLGLLAATSLLLWWLSSRRRSISSTP